MRKILLCLTLLLLGVFLLGSARAANETKSLTYFVGQATSSVTSVSFPFSFYLGDDAPVVKGAFFEIEGISPNSAALTIDATLSGGSGSCALSRTLDTNGARNSFRMRYNVLDCINISGKGDYSRTLNLAFGSAVDVVTSHFIITYQYSTPSSQGSSAVRTVWFAADTGTATSTISSGQNFVFPFTIYVGDTLTSLKGAFFEVSGISAATGGTTLSLSLGGGSGTCAISRTIDTTGRHNAFTFRYDVTSCIDIPAKGSYSRTLTINSASSNISIYSAHLALTYTFTPPVSGGYVPSGILISPVFDTGTANGASFNSILLKGPTTSGTKVRAQFAASNTSSTNSFTFIGPDCTANTYYYDATLPGTDTPYEIGCPGDHNNKRFFRYKLMLCSASDCTSAGSVTPEVQEVIVNWSP